MLFVQIVIGLELTTEIRYNLFNLYSHQLEHPSIMARRKGGPKGRYDEGMKIDKFFQHRGWSRKRYRDVRNQVNRFLIEEYGVREAVSRCPHKAKKLVRLQHPEQLSTMKKL